MIRSERSRKNSTASRASMMLWQMRRRIIEEEGRDAESGNIGVL